MKVGQIGYVSTQDWIVVRDSSAEHSDAIGVRLPPSRKIGCGECSKCDQTNDQCMSEVAYIFKVNILFTIK